MHVLKIWNAILYDTKRLRYEHAHLSSQRSGAIYEHKRDHPGTLGTYHVMDASIAFRHRANT